MDQNAIRRLKAALDEAECVILGAGAGLSTSAGFIYTGERFDRYFADFGTRYGFSDMYSGGFAPFKTPEEQWAYWSRYIYINRYMDPPRSVYHDLYKLVKDKDYFVLTTNVDHCFQKAGFDKERLFYTQGDYGLWQCSKPCHKKTYDNKDAVREMLLAQGYSFDENDALTPPKEGAAMAIPSKLVPRCPVCGRPMSMNLRADNTFVEDEGWHEAMRRYVEFLNAHQEKKTVFLELAVGFNTPGIIKYSFWQMTNEWPDATYACLNYGDAYAPVDIQQKSIAIDGDIGDILNAIEALKV